MGSEPFAGLPRWREAPPEIRVYQLPTAGIQFLTALTEAADGIGLVRTLDEGRGIVECWVEPDFAEVFDKVIAAVARDYPLQRLAWPFE